MWSAAACPKLLPSWRCSPHSLTKSVVLTKSLLALCLARSLILVNHRLFESRSKRGLFAGRTDVSMVSFLRENSGGWSLPWKQPLLETSPNCLGIGAIRLSGSSSVCWIPVADAKYLKPPKNNTLNLFLISQISSDTWQYIIFSSSPSSPTSCQLCCCTTAPSLLIKDELCSNKGKRMFSQRKAVCL